VCVFFTASQHTRVEGESGGVGAGGCNEGGDGVIGLREVKWRFVLF